MSVNNPNFPVGQGDRRVDDTQKQELLTRIPKAHIGSAASAPLALNMSHAVSTYQVLLLYSYCLNFLFWKYVVIIVSIIRNLFYFDYLGSYKL
jgi:hypothetical protein